MNVRGKLYIADITDLKYNKDDNALMYGDTKIDMVYRRAVTSEIIEKYDETIEFINAYLNNAFVCVGSFRSQIAHNKNIFAFFIEKK